MRAQAPIKQHYADSAEIERQWTTWAEGGCRVAWRQLQENIYKICQGVATQFNPKNEDEHLELSHETFTLTIEKIKSGRLTFKPGKAPVFNLLTTTIFRHLFSLKNKQNRRQKLLLTKYIQQSGIINKITDDRPELAKHILGQRHDPNYHESIDAKPMDGSRYIVDHLDFIHNDADYRLVSFVAKKRKPEAALSVQLSRAKSRVRRNIEVYGDYASFLCELIDILKERPAAYVFQCGIIGGAPVEIQTRLVDRNVGPAAYRYLNINFVRQRVVLAVEQSRVQGLIDYTMKFLGTSSSG